MPFLNKRKIKKKNLCLSVDEKGSKFFLKTESYNPTFSADKLKTTKGFSLIELLVSIAILVIVSGLVFFNQSGFNNNVLIENLAYEISLTIRQAQSYGLQSRELGTGTDTFMIGYGIFFDIDNNDELILYADVNKNHLYDEGGDDEIVDVLKMTNKNEIKKLCVGDPCLDVDILNIGFIRPNPTAYINIDKEIGKIYIKSPRDEEKKIIVNKIGQISIE